MIKKSLGVVVALCTPALAQPVEPAAGPTSTPGFAILDRQDSQSAVGLEASYLFLANDSTDATALHFDLNARVVNPQGMGGYVQVPVVLVTGDGDSVTAFGDIELGGIFTKALGPTAGVVAHAGLTLPTASTELDKALTGLFVQLVRPTDYYQFVPGGTSLRLGVSPVIRKDNLYARIDAGLDLNLDIRTADDTADSLIHLNVGVGIDTGAVQIGGELSHIMINDNSLDVAALSARLPGKTSPYAALVVPVDEDARDIYDAAITAGVTIGI